jgi:PAS domain S-box-containing protein
MLLEMTFIFVGLMILHALRKNIGIAAFYLGLGLLLVFTQFVGATELKVTLHLNQPGADFYIAQTVLFMPYLAILMVIYVTEGTLATQRVIIGVMATLGLYLYLSQITAAQCGWVGESISKGAADDALEYLLYQSKRSLAASTLAQTFDLFLIPILFQRLRNMNCRLFLSVLGALMLTQLTHSFIFVTANFWGQPEWWYHMSSSYIANAIVTIWLSMLVTLYLSKIEKERPGEGRGTLDIVFAFFGGYSKAQMLEKDLLESQGRYRMVVENASDMILILDREEKIVDANLAALKIFNSPAKEEIISKKFPDDFLSSSEKAIHSEKRWKKMFRKQNTDTQHIHDIPIHAVSSTGREVDIDVSISQLRLDSELVTIVFGRDVTAQNRLNKEKEELREQLGHAQRLESVGRLAGGVAHDFNNYLHAIQGHLDILAYMHEINDEKVESHLDRIDNITQQAAELTQKLLGFARKGKYVDKELNLEQLVKDSIELFMPASQKNIDLNLKNNLGQVKIKGDQVQLHQVFLNLMINARDAMEDKSNRKMAINITIDEGKVYQNHCITPHNEKIPAEKFYCVIIEDTGEGMDKATLKQIFDPFFTTKPTGKGTGMGLAMVYGTITNHNGVIDVNSTKGEGTIFYIFLPKIIG